MSVKITIDDFFETQHRPYAIYDTARSIANVVDGQKITSRKVLHTCLIRTNEQIKVAQLCSQVAYETEYHHGEAGIGGVICNLAQDFTGSNNINLLEPIGQFGSRLSPIPAAHRYIFTKLSQSFKTIFKDEDRVILEHLYEDDKKIEPKYFLPIIPVILINGSQGIGTGYASKVLSYNPTDLKNDIIAILNGTERTTLIPWYKGYRGLISSGDNPNQWVFKGKLEIVNSTTIRITELPIGMFLDDIKAVLNKLKESDDIRDYDDNSTENGFDIEVKVARTTSAMNLDALYTKFKLISRDTENLTLWDVSGKLQNFLNASSIVDYFVNFRLVKYEERRLKWIDIVKLEISDLTEKIRFIDFYIENSNHFKNLSKPELLKYLQSNGFINGDKLIMMPIYSLTKDKIAELNTSLKTKEKELKRLIGTTAKKMYMSELNSLTF